MIGGGRRAREVRSLVGVSTLFAATFGTVVLAGWEFSRPLLPVTVVGCCLLAGWAEDRKKAARGSTVAGSSDSPRAALAPAGSA